MMKRYEALLMTWNSHKGHWTPSSLGCFGTVERAKRRLAKISRYYTRYERYVDFGEVYDRKKGCYVRGLNDLIDVNYTVHTIGDMW